MYDTNSINALISRFKTQELPLDEWTHQAHLVVAIWFCWDQGYEDALKTVRSLIIRYNDSVGTPNSEDSGYHETLTQFWLKVVADYLSNGNFQSILNAFQSFISTPMASRNYPLEFYSRKLLFSIDARYNWVPPDLKHPGFIYESS